MKLLLIRHAHAIDRGDKGADDLTDEARYLTARGREVALAMGERLHAAGYRFDAMLTSPLTRAVQTAELVAQGARYRGDVVALMTLAPDHSVKKAARDLEGAGAVVGVVGHEPSISALAGHLLGRAHAPMRKAQVVVIEDGKQLA